MERGQEYLLENGKAGRKRGIDMERLTIDEIIEHCDRKTGMYEKSCDVKYLETAVMGNRIKEYWEHKQVSEYLRKLKDYEDLDEQGRLVKLPCKVGDTVYVPTRDFISELRIVHISISKNNTFFHWMLNDGIYQNLDGFSVDKIGKTVFLTKSEAEAKLKELRGGEK